MDKLYHLFASFILAILNPFFALGCGVGKEVGDWMNYGKLDRSKEYFLGVAGDLLADAIGVFFGYQIWRMIWT
jgi:hypothetical protein